MGWIILIIVIAVIIGWYKIGNQQIDQTVLTVHWLELLLYTCDDREDLEKLLYTAYVNDSNTYTTGDFNRKWKILCKAARVFPHMNDYGGVISVSDRVIPMIATNIYENPYNRKRVHAMKERLPKTVKLDYLKKEAALEED